MNAMLTPSQENYLETIYLIQKKNRVARVKDIAELVNVKASSVIEAVANLKDKGLAVQESYGYIELTLQGEKIAKALYKRHETLTLFFDKVLGVPKDIAEEDACRIEHYLSKETVERILEFVKNYESNSDNKR